MPIIFIHLFPFLISSKIKNDSVKTFIINDTFENLQGNLKLKVIDFYGKEIWTTSKKIQVLENSSQQYFSFSLDKIDRKNTVLIAEFNNKKSYFYFAKPKKLNLPKGEIQQKITKNKNGFSITLKSDVLQKDVFLFTTKKDLFSDNFFDLLPNKPKTVFFETEAKSLQDIKFKTLNNL